MLRCLPARFGLSTIVATALFGDIGSACAQDQKPAATPEASTLVTVSVVDAAGKPLAGAEAYLIEGNYDLPLSKAWVAADSSGEARMTTEHVDASLLDEHGGGNATLVVRAPGHSWSMQKVALPATETVKVGMRVGRTVDIALTQAAGTSLPQDLQPIIFAEGISVAAWLANVQRVGTEGSQSSSSGDKAFNPTVPVREGSRFRVQVPEDCQSMWVLINHPGFLRCFQAGPFDRAAIERGSIDIALPRPATVTVNITPDAEKPHEYKACMFEVMTSPEIPDGGWSFQLHQQFASEPSLKATLVDLAPGNYQVSAQTGDKTNRHVRERADYYRAQTGVEAKAGESANLDIALQTFDEKWWRDHLKGEHSLTIKVTKPDGSPAAGRKYVLAYTLQQFGRTLSLQEGEVPASGEITAKSLAAGEQSAWLAVSVDGNELGTIFIDSAKPLTSAEFGVPPQVGELAPDLTLTRLSDGSTFTLSSLRGQVVLLDFWASWCGPCQEPMAHNNSLLTRRTDYTGKVTLIGASIDDKIETIRQHVNKRGWNAVLQTFCGEGEAGWGCKAAKTYAVRAVPTAYLIGTDGRITWTGHPSEINLEQEIDKLLAK